MNWTPDAELLEQTTQLGEQLLKTLCETDSSTMEQNPDAMEDWNLFLEVAGTLFYLDQSGWVRERVGACDSLQFLVENPLGFWNPDSLGDLAELFDLELALTDAALIPGDPEEQADSEGTGTKQELAERVIEVLRRRDRVQLQLAGARAISGRMQELSPEVVEIIEEFDEQLKNFLYLMIPVNHVRQHRVLWVRPETSTDFWWWEKGYTFPENALESFHTACEVMRVFPESRRLMELIEEQNRKLDEWTWKLAATKAGETPETGMLRLLEALNTVVADAADDTPCALCLAAEPLYTGYPWKSLREFEDFTLQGTPGFMRILLRSPIRYSPESTEEPKPVATIEFPGDSGVLLPCNQETGRSAEFDLSSDLFRKWNYEGQLKVRCRSHLVTISLSELFREPS